MSWQDQLKGDSLSWLLETNIPGVRYLALRDLLEYPRNDPELRKACTTAHQKGPISTILNEMDSAGYWIKPGPGYDPRYRSTVWSMILLAELGASAVEDERISRACSYLLDHALTEKGQFSMTGAPSGTIDCLQGNLAWALLEMDYEDPRLELAFDWIRRSVTGEGIAPLEDKVAEERYYAAKCGPNFTCGYNNQRPCAWGCVRVLLAMEKWLEKRGSPIFKNAIENGIDFLFSVDPMEATYPTARNPKPSKNWWKFGFPVFYVTDLLQLVEVLAKLGYGADPRLSGTIAFILDKQDDNGRWRLEHDYTGRMWVEFGERNQSNKWVTLRALRTLKAISAD